MNALIPDAMAQAGAPGPAGGIAPLLMMVVFIVIFNFLLIRFCFICLIRCRKQGCGRCSQI